MAELLADKPIDYPPSKQVNVTFKKAPRAKLAAQREPKLPFGGMSSNEEE